MVEPRVISEGDLRVGLRAEFDRDITAEDVLAFAALSRDRNPLHVDQDYAAHTNYGGCIVHGAFQVALASAMAGMYLPGRDVVVGAFQCRFPAPLRYPSQVRVQGEVIAWVPASQSGTLRVRVVETSAMTMTSEIHVSFSLHERRTEAAASRVSDAPAADSGKDIVLVTGAGGGLGRQLIERLSGKYHVLALARRQPDDVSAGGSVEWVMGDLSAPDWESSLEGVLRERKLYGVVHAAWPSGPQGGLLDVEPSAVASQILFGGETTIRLAKFLRANARESARLVILGTTAGTLKPVLNMSAYSLGKATLEHTVRLIAPELARSNITVNLVAPSFVPVGMNSAKTNRVVLTETAKVPLGRLCSSEDVAGSVEFFLSPAASFITGQMLPLTGGQL